MPDRIEAATYLAAVAVAGGEITARGRPARPHGHVHPEARRHGRAHLARSRRPVGDGARPAAVGRRRHAAVPGRRDRLQAAARRRCWRSPTASASSPRTSSRAGSATSTSSSAWAPTSAPTTTTPSCGASSACRARRCGRPTSGPAPPSCSPGSRPTARPSCTTPTTSTAATRTSPARLRSLGADVVAEP